MTWMEAARGKKQVILIRGIAVLAALQDALLLPHNQMPKKGVRGGIPSSLHLQIQPILESLGERDMKSAPHRVCQVSLLSNRQALSLHAEQFLQCRVSVCRHLRGFALEGNEVV